jgi:S1-C subfamily serine protease
VATDLVITNAHVVAGTTTQWVRVDGREVEASVVAFDPDLDIALLRTAGLGIEPLGLLRGEAERGDVGAVLGYPGGGSLNAEGAAVRAVIEPVGRNIYGEGQVRRRVYEVQAPIMSGNSGGPFVLANGRVAGLVFASSIADDDVGYAIVAGEFAPMIETAATATDPVGTGACAR